MAEQDIKTGAENVVWDLSVLYASIDDPTIDADMQKAEVLAGELANTYKGKVASLDANALFDVMKAAEGVYDLVERLGAFAFLIYSTDTADVQLGALVQKMTEFGAKISQMLVFLSLEWNAVDEARARVLLEAPILAEYRHYLESERRYKPYQLDETSEQLLIEKSVTGRQAWVRFFTQLTGAMRYPYDGEPLTQSQVLSKLFDPERDTRKKAADSVTAGLREKSMELTYIFNVLAADKSTDDRLRGYGTWVSSRNLSNKVPDAVVEALVDAVTSRYDLVARHYTLKRTLLGVDELTDYDRYAPLPVKQSDKRYTWDTAREIVLSSFGAFHPRMAEVAAKFFDESWIHARLLPNKRGGAYSASVTPSAHPFVFLNYIGQAKDVATLAHELGHGIHQYMAGENNNIFHADTPLTTAEMASTFGEMLVFSDLTAKEDDPEARLAMISEKVEDTFGTVFRQIAMNRFEHAMHTARRKEGELTHERLSALWLEAQKAMFQDSVTLRDDYSLWWSYIPHFLHTPGYVYAYSFGELLVYALYNLYQQEGASFVPKYLDVLAAGGSDYPDKILAKLGVDLNDPAFWRNGLDAIEALIAQEETLAKEVYPGKWA